MDASIGSIGTIETVSNNSKIIESLTYQIDVINERLQKIILKMYKNKEDTSLIGMLNKLYKNEETERQKLTDKVRSLRKANNELLQINDSSNDLNDESEFELPSYLIEKKNWLVTQALESSKGNKVATRENNKVKESLDKSKITEPENHRPNQFEAILQAKTDESLRNCEKTTQYSEILNKILSIKPKIIDLEITYNALDNEYIFNYKLLQRGKNKKDNILECSPLRIIPKMDYIIKKDKIIEEYNLEHDVKLSDKIDLNIFYGLLSIDEKGDYGTNLAENYQNGKLQATITYNLKNIMESRLNLVQKYAIYKNAMDQKEFINANIFDSELMKDKIAKFNKVKQTIKNSKIFKPKNVKNKSVKFFKDTIKPYCIKFLANPISYLKTFFKPIGITTASVLALVGTIYGIKKLPKNNNAESTVDGIVRAHNGMDEEDVSLDSKDETINDGPIVEYVDDKITIDYSPIISKELQYFEENYNINIQNLIDDQTSRYCVDETQAKAMVLGDLRGKYGVEFNNDGTLKKDETAESTKENKGIVASRGVSTIESEKNLGYRLLDQVNLTGRVLTEDSQGNGGKCYVDNLECDSFKISYIVVWNGNQVLDTIKVGSENENIDTNSLYKTYGADIDISLNFNGYSNGKLKYEYIGWINIDEIVPLTIEQKQAIVDLEDTSILEEDLDDSVSLQQSKFHQELKNELASNEMLKKYKLTFGR